MVGRDDIPVIHISNHDDKNENSTYSVQKEKKKTNMELIEEQAVDNEVDNVDFMTFVDNFVQRVIERARQEYLGSCANGVVETRVQEENDEDKLHTGRLRYPFPKPIPFKQ